MSSSRQSAQSPDTSVKLECPTCGSLTAVRLKGTVTTPDGRRVPNVTRWVCSRCHEELYDTAALKLMRSCRARHTAAA